MNPRIWGVLALLLSVIARAEPGGAPPKHEEHSVLERSPDLDSPACRPLTSGKSDYLYKPGPNELILEGHLSPDGKFAYLLVHTGAQPPEGRLIALDTGRVVTSVPRGILSLTSPFSEDSRVVELQQSNDSPEITSRLVNLPDGTASAPVNLGDAAFPVSARISSRGTILGTSGFDLQLMDLRDPTKNRTLPNPLPGQSKQWDQAFLSPNGEQLIIRAEQTFHSVNLTTFAPEGPSITSPFSLRPKVTFLPDGSGFVVSEGRDAEYVPFAAFSAGGPDATTVSLGPTEEPIRAVLSSGGLNELVLVDSKGRTFGFGRGPRRRQEVPGEGYKHRLSQGRFTSSLQVDRTQLRSFPEGELLASVSLGTDPFDQWGGDHELRAVLPEGVRRLNQLQTTCAPLPELASTLRLPDTAPPTPTNLCRLPPTAQAWKQYAPTGLTALRTAEDVDHALARLAKPGGLDLARDAGLLHALLGSDEVQTKRPDALARVLENLVTLNPVAYEGLMDLYEKLNSLPYTSPPAQAPCRTPDETTLVQRGVEAYLENQLTRLNGHAAPGDNSHPPSPYGVVKHWAHLRPLRAALRNLPDERRHHLIGELTERIRDNAIRSFPTVFPSTLYYFVEPTVAELFGETPKSRTLLVAQKENTGFRPLLLGTGSMGENSHLSTYGFYSMSLNEVNVPADHTGPANLGERGVFQWTHEGRPYRGEVSAHVHETNADIIPTGDRPDYTAMWRDRNFVGGLVVGENMGIPQGDILVRQLKGFFERRGYVFSGPQAIRDLEGVLGRQIASGELDYLMKEAHSGGDDQNLIRILSTANLLHGIKRNADGTTAQIYLYQPTGAHHAAPGVEAVTSITNRDFGQWIRERTANGHGQLAYFNSSCHSFHKAANEISATRDPNLLNICSTTLIYPFRDHPEDAERLMFEGFLGQKSFPEIRTLLGGNPRYRSGETNQFIFPDQPEYAHFVRSRVEIPFDLHTRVFDADGNEVHIDSRH